MNRGFAMHFARMVSALLATIVMAHAQAQLGGPSYNTGTGVMTFSVTNCAADAPIHVKITVTKPGQQAVTLMDGWANPGGPGQRSATIPDLPPGTVIQVEVEVHVPPGQQGPPQFLEGSYQVPE